MKAIRSMACALALVAGLAGMARAEEDGRGFSVRVGVAGVLPDESADISAIGGDVDISDEYVPATIIGYRFSDQISAELFCCFATHEVDAVDTALGRVDLGEVTLFPPILTGVYRFNPSGRFQPYVGAGVNFTHFFDEAVPSGLRAITYDDSFGPALQVGIDVPINDRWFVNLDVKKVWIQTDVRIDAGALGVVDAEVDINPIVAFAGVGYKF